MISPRARTLILYTIASLLILLVFLGSLETLKTYRLAVDLYEAASALQAMAEGDLGSLDVAETTVLIRRARSDAEAIHTRTRILAPLTNRLGWLPQIGPLVAAADPLVEYAAALTAAGDELLTSLGPLIDSDPGATAPSASISARLTTTLVETRSNLAAARQALRQAETARSQFDIQSLPPSLQSPLEKIDRLLPLAGQAVEVLEALPTILGADGPRTYLLLAQNHDELRATGGFISGVGTVVVEQGELLNLSMGDSYAVDDLSKIYPAPPEPLQRYMLAEQWLVRDANWSPDFPTAAEKIRELYSFSTGASVDGVIAFDQTALRRVLAATGPVDLPGVPEPVGADNIETYIHQAWAPAPGEDINQEWWEHRKDFMGELGGAIVERVQTSGDQATLLALARAAVDMIQEKHLLVFVDDPTVSRALAELGWDGALRPFPGDILMVVDSNVGFNKVDPKVARAIEYRVDLRRPEALTASLALTYTHQAEGSVPCEHRPTYGQGTYADLQARCYWDYVRVYTPAGSEHLEGSLPTVPADWLMNGEEQPGLWSANEGDAGTTVFGGLFVLPMGDQATLELTYALPDAVILRNSRGTLAYMLRLVKQPGTMATPITVTITPPTGYAPNKPSGWEKLPNGDFRWSGRLSTDMELLFYLDPLSK